MLHGHLYVFFGTMSIQVFCPFFNQIVFWNSVYMSYLCILNINPLSVISFSDTLSHLICCLFILLMVYFVTIKIFCLIKSHLFLFCFLCLRSKKYCYSLCQRVFFLCFLLGVLWFLVFRSSSYFEFTSVYSVKKKF